MQVLVPDSTGWMLLRNMVAARRYPSLAVSLTTAPSPVKRRGICFLAARATAVKTNPMAADVVVATTTENLAAFGWLAPSSFETRTLTRNDHRKGELRVSVVSTANRWEPKQCWTLPYCSIEAKSNHQRPKLIVHAVTKTIKKL